MTQRTKVPRKLDDVLQEVAQARVNVWAERNREYVWLGANSRAQMVDEIKSDLRWAYELAKKKYTT